MAYVPWVPRIVGGSDHVEKKANVIPLTTGLDNMGGAIMITHEELSEYVNSLNSLPDEVQSHLGIESFHFEYGPIKTIMDNDEIHRGQYVIEYRNGHISQTFWIETV